MSAIRSAMQPAIQTGTDLLADFETAFALIPDSPEKRRARVTLIAFHKHLSQTLQSEGYRFVTTDTTTGNDDEIIVAPQSAGSGGKD